MKKFFASKGFIAVLSVIAGLYVMFLLLPFILLPFLNSAMDNLSKSIEKDFKIKTEFSKFRLITTPKLTAGIKCGNFRAYLPNGDKLIDADNFKFKISLIPLLYKRIEADVISADRADINLAVKSDGHFLLEDAFLTSKPENKSSSVNNSKTKNEALLPFGLKLSNKLPDIRIKSHKITFIDYDTKKEYILSGNDTYIVDFIFNKKVKIESKGSLVLDKFSAFTYDVKVLNKIMPDIDINDLFVQDSSANGKKTNSKDSLFNIIDVFNLIKANGLTLNLLADVTVEGTLDNPKFQGAINADKISMLSSGEKLPDSNISVQFKGDEFDIKSSLLSAKNESTVISGKIKSGKRPELDITCTSNATLNSLVKIVNTFALIFGIDDLKTVNAAGQLDVNFNLKSDFKKINSNGYLKLNNGLINYGLYDIKINDLIADILLDNNAVIINKAGFSTLSVPFDIKGKISNEAKCDIKISTVRLPVKGLLISLGQSALLKENLVNSGFITINANVSGDILKPNIEGNVDLYNLNVKNIPSDITLTLNPLNIKLKTNDKGYSGQIYAQNTKIINPAITVSADMIKGSIDENKIEFEDTKVLAGKNSLNIKGVISDYIKENIQLDFSSSGNIKSRLSGYINPYKMILNIDYDIPSDAKIIIPGFDKSELITSGTVNVSGSMLNPILQGQFKVPEVSIPEVPVNMTNMNVYLNGPILKGNADVQNFTSGGIAAQNITSDFSLIKTVFYLKNLKGAAFEGSFDGEIAYDILSTECDVLFGGQNMSALKAIEGAAGIKNALTGTLKFDADINFKGIEYSDMMNSMKGNAEFEIVNGVLANLGSLKMILGAQNIISNSVLKSTAQNITALPAVQSASEFDYIKGNLRFDKGYAILEPVVTSGSSMAYYITGRFHLLNGTVNAIVLGRLSEDVASILGSISDFAVDTITSLIPGLESVTTKLAKTMTISPDKVDTSKIPALGNNETEYKDFRVEFNGGVDSQSSVKTFKWVANADTQELEKSQTQKQLIEAQNAAKEQLNLIKEGVKEDAKVIEQSAKEFYNQNKEQINKLKDDANDLFKSLFQTPSSTPDTESLN